MITPLKTLFCTPKRLILHTTKIAPPPLPARPSTATAAWASRHPSPPGLLPRQRPGRAAAPPLPAFFRGGGQAATPPVASRPSSAAGTEQHQPIGLLPRQQLGSAATELLRACN